MRSVFRRLTPLLITLLFFVSAPAVWAQEATTEPDSPATAEAIATAESTAPAEDSPEPEASPESTAEPAVGPVLIIDGSPAFAPLMQGLVDAYTEAAGDGDNLFEIETNGPNIAFERFCAGEIPMVLSPRFITAQEEADCTDNSIAFVENWLAADALVVLLSANSATSCLALPQLEGIFGIAAEGVEVNLQQFDPNAESQVLTVYTPASSHPAYELAQAGLPGGDLRTDASPYEDTQALVDSLAEENAIALLSLADYQALESTGDALLLNLSATEGGNCESPNAEALEQNRYPTTRPALLYVNAALGENESVSDFVAFVNEGEALGNSASEHQLIAASDSTLALNQSFFEDGSTGRTFSRSDAPAFIAGGVEGSLIVAGAPLAATLINPLSADFSLNNPLATSDVRLLGETAGLAALCAGEAQVALSSTPTPQLECETISTPLGTDALVFAVTDYPELPTCLTLDQLVTAFAAPLPESGETPAAEGREVPQGPQNWNELESSFPDMPLLILLRGQSSYEVDWLLVAADATERFSRFEGDPAVLYSPSASNAAIYNATAAGNFTGGALTALRWQDYQAYLEAKADADAAAEAAPEPAPEADAVDEVEAEATEEAAPEATEAPEAAAAEEVAPEATEAPEAEAVDEVEAEATEEAAPEATEAPETAAPAPQGPHAVRLLEVDAGAGCVAPSEASILDGSYPLAMGFRLHSTESALENPAASAFVWSLLSDNSLSALEGAGLLGFERSSFTQQREQVFRLIEAAGERAAAAAAEAEMAATAEPSATDEPEMATMEADNSVEAEATESAEAEATESAD